jgi:valyl-tRNA synthetase
MSDSLPKAYDPKKVEDKWYKFWLENGFFHADPHSQKKPFTIILPPPNVTGVLHMGHALDGTLQDILIRYKRMQGFEALWVPGTDHAGIATQTVVERQLFAKEGKRRKDYPREVFLEHVWRFKEENQSKILSQLKKLGSSCDWERLRFTMDDRSNRAVRTAFKKMYDEGYIYRGDYLVNWDPVTQTALADDEVEHEERDSSLWYFKYPLQDKSGFIVVATTRPETMLGDTAVAVNPKDERYAHLIGKKALLPIVEREIPIIADPFVEPTFGSGAVKITPAHDPNDYEMAQRHTLPMLNILTPDGKINENGEPFQGLSVEDARKAVVKKMEQLGLVEKIEPHKLKVGVSYRSKAVIQPYLSKQWFVKMEPFKKKLLAAVKKKRVKLIPSHWEDTYFHWIENLRDWCISRQLWWGHRIPIWYRIDNPEIMICHDGDDLPQELHEQPNAWRQDEDVLDTWFSSALWPFSSLGWPENTPELQKFYPTSTLITGHDILFFWVARMILMGEFHCEDVPFQETFIHGLIYGKSYWREKEGTIQYVPPEEKAKYDLGEPVPKNVFSKWEKMSKSKGNIIDPLEIIDTYGTDAMRMALTSSVTFARQIDLDRRRFEEFKNFANKIWNGARFVFMNLAPENGKKLTSEIFAKGIDEKLLTLEDRWILSLLNRNIKEVSKNLDEYCFDKAAQISYEFFWKDFCAYYLELVKPVLFGKTGSEELRENKQRILTVVLTAICRLLHPMAPFITEEIFSCLKKLFQSLPEKSSEPYVQDTLQALKAPSCMVSTYPTVLREHDINAVVEKTFSFMESIVYAVRNIRAELKIPLNETTDLIIISEKKEHDRKVAEENASFLTSLLKVGKLSFEDDVKKTNHGFGSVAVVSNLKLFVPLPEQLKHQEKERLHKEKEKIKKTLLSLQNTLDNSEFRLKAPKEVLDKMTATVEESEKALKEIDKKLSHL